MLSFCCLSGIIWDYCIVCCHKHAWVYWAFQWMHVFEGLESKPGKHKKEHSRHFESRVSSMNKLEHVCFNRKGGSLTSATMDIYQHMTTNQIDCGANTGKNWQWSHWVPQNGTFHFEERYCTHQEEKIGTMISNKIHCPCGTYRKTTHASNVFFPFASALLKDNPWRAGTQTSSCLGGHTLGLWIWATKTY